MGNKVNKEDSKTNFEDFKKEYFKAVNKDFKDTFKKINTKIHYETKSNTDKESWVDYLKEKFIEHNKNNQISNKNLEKIILYLNNLGESNESKHIFNLSVFLKKYFDDSIKSKHKNLLDTYYSNAEIENEKLDDITDISKDTILWRGSEFIFEDIEHIDHPLCSFIRYLSYILAEIYEKDFEKAELSLKDKEYFNNSLILQENKYQREMNIKTEPTFLESLENDKIFNFKKNKNEKTHKSAVFSSYKYIGENTNLVNYFTKIQKEIIYFSNILTGALIRFYNIKNSCSEKILEIFLEKIKDIFIRHDLYRVIFKIKSSLLSTKKNEFSANLIKLYNIKPNYLGTSPYFSQDLNYRKILRRITQEILKSDLEENIFSTPDNNKFSNILNIQRLSLNNENNIHINLLDNFNENYLQSEIDENFSTIPFSETLALLRKLNDCNSILERIDLMFMLRASILSEIDKFWEKIPLKMKHRSVDADNLLSIFIYIIIKSQITNLIIDIEIIDSFISKNIKLSRKGYYFSIFQSSIDYIISNVNMEQFDINLKEYNFNIKNELRKIGLNPNSVLDLSEEKIGGKNKNDELSEKDLQISSNMITITCNDFKDESKD